MPGGVVESEREQTASKSHQDMAGKKASIFSETVRGC